MSTLSLVNSQFLASQGHKPDCNSDMNDRCEKGDGKYKQLLQEIWMEREEVKTRTEKGMNRRL